MGSYNRTVSIDDFAFCGIERRTHRIVKCGRDLCLQLPLIYRFDIDFILGVVVIIGESPGSFIL
jgi:hypothetical protein